MQNNLGNRAVMARNLQHYMDLHQKTRADLCSDLGLKYTTLVDWLRGNTYPRIDKIELLANYFNISKADLVEAHPLDGSSYYLEPEAIALSQFLFQHPNHRGLFEAVMAVGDADVDYVRDLVLRLTGGAS